MSNGSWDCRDKMVFHLKARLKSLNDSLLILDSAQPEREGRRSAGCQTACIISVRVKGYPERNIIALRLMHFPVMLHGSLLAAVSVSLLESPWE